MTLLDVVPDVIKNWYKPETAKLKKRDVRFFTIPFGKL